MCRKDANMYTFPLLYKPIVNFWQAQKIISFIQIPTQYKYLPLWLAYIFSLWRVWSRLGDYPQFCIRVKSLLYNMDYRFLSLSLIS